MSDNPLTPKTLINQNYFVLFSLSESFKIPLEVLEKNYQILLQTFHPDKFAGGDKVEQAQALQVGAYINSAYNILINPVTRAQYILGLWGYEKVLQERYINPEFVEEQIQLREKVNNINNYQQLQEVVNLINININSLLLLMEEEFNQLRSIDVPPVKIAQSIKQLQLWSKLLELAQDKEV